MNKDLELEVTHTTLLGMHTAKLGDGTGLAVLLKWNGLPEYEATWDDFSAIQLHYGLYPTFHLKDKVRFESRVMLYITLSLQSDYLCDHGKGKVR